jgi:hypothetical protein
VSTKTVNRVVEPLRAARRRTGLKLQGVADGINRLGLTNRRGEPLDYDARDVSHDEAQPKLGPDRELRLIEGHIEGIISLSVSSDDELGRALRFGRCLEECERLDRLARDLGLRERGDVFDGLASAVLDAMQKRGLLRGRALKGSAHVTATHALRTVFEREEVAKILCDSILNTIRAEKVLAGNGAGNAPL